MCEDNRHDKSFRNAETIQRRAWVDLAITSVRNYLAEVVPPADPDSAPAQRVPVRGTRPKRARLRLVRNDNRG